jgi:hypothetical protein
VHRSAWIGTVALLLGAILTASAGCPDVSNTGVLPVTGVEVDIADLLTGANLACGTGPGDVYKYAAIANLDVAGTDRAIDDCNVAPLAGGVFDCFSLGTLGNLPLQDGGVVMDGGTVVYSVQIYFFTYDVYSPDAGDYATQIQNAVSPMNTSPPAICKLPYSWATTCTATEADDIKVNASCRPITSAAAVKDAGSRDATKDAKPKDVLTDPPAETETETGEETGTGTDGATDGASPDGAHDGATDAPAG